MCSQRAIADNLECCIDDLIEGFEDFIRKSLLLIFLGIGVVIGLLIYLLKMIAERSPITNNAIAVTGNENRVPTKRSMIEEKMEKEIISNNLEEDKTVKTMEKLINKTTKNNMSQVKNTAGMSSYNNLLPDGCLSSCSKHGCSGVSPSLPSRVPVPISPVSSSKHTMIPCVRKRSLNKSNLPSLQICPPMTKQGSCCSMCCHDEKKPSEDSKGIKIYSNR